MGLRWVKDTEVVIPADALDPARHPETLSRRSAWAVLSWVNTMIGMDPSPKTKAVLASQMFEALPVILEDRPKEREDGN